ncbi:hypothetical protein PIB30_074718 [Stylosanthes scabra]|uniref:Uncharacterized protein n=1 Tax=Stylosanthes scabra TaxID=79078 RepID=A0ABU6TS02_9FABA|nr:hypothetical protein [Stylosanthes scabra]
MAHNLFEGLPPPQNHDDPEPPQQQQQKPRLTFATTTNNDAESSQVAPPPPPPPPAPKPILKSALKRPNPTPSDTQAAAPKKSLKFKTSTDASEAQVIDAMKKITSHIKNPAKHLNKKQRNQLAAWTIMAIIANDLYTDDSFVFSKAAGQIKDAISNLPVATEDDDAEEAMSLEDNTNVADGGSKTLATDKDNNDEEQADPFGLDALLPESTKKGEKLKTKNEGTVKIKEDEEETKRFLKSQREALITCLEIAARRYKTPWCQTVIDILVKHAFDNVARFTAHQRDAIGKLWASIREQLTRRKQGKSVNGKLDVNGFEWLQQKYAGEKISIRHSVGGSGDRRAQQWLG